MDIETTDTDAGGAPLGLSSVWEAGDAGVGTLRVILRHYPSGGKEPDDPANSPKSTTDADVAFPLLVQP